MDADRSEVSEGDRLDRHVDWDRLLRHFSDAATRGAEDQQLRASRELRRLCKYAPECVLRETIAVLVGLLGSPNSAVQEAAARSLSCVARWGVGGHRCALTAAAAATGGRERRLAECLRTLVAFDNGNRVILARNGGLEGILHLIPLCADETRGCLLEVLSAVAMLWEVRRAIVHTGGLPLLIEAVSCGPMTSRRRAAHAIGLMATASRVHHMLVDWRVVPALLDLLREGDPQAKLTAANSLGIISSHVDYLRLVAQAGAIPLYAELLEGQDALGKEIAEDVFCILAVVEENAVLICAQLVKILRGDDEDAKAAAADVLWGLSGHNHSFSVIGESGAIPLLLSLLQEGGDDAREKALGAIVQMSYDEADRRVLADEGAIPVLIGLLRSESEELEDNAIEALVNFSEDPFLCDRVSEVSDHPLFLAVRVRLAIIRSSDEHLIRSLQQLSVDHFTSHPELM
ncbi:unnamed protein product [Spirodela intermedia]|uniref:Uncharacterized protein n=1 Tax=Spirodela intermedia TaxID=51605 RepID=A0A7I8IHL4_SPIIN|nr:unnamed protein product [Spirodela intermedia]CAA6657284.1 unnamed protein product [Spirodela intermedia]